MPASKSYLLLSDVKTILAAAEAHAVKNAWPVTIVVTDDGGQMLGSLRLDGCAPLAGQIAAEKARVAALSWKESGVYEEIINQGRTAFLSAPGNGYLEGGVPVIKDGRVIGAVGVSGVKSAQDAETAKAGIAALGL